MLRRFLSIIFCLTLLLPLTTRTTKAAEKSEGQVNLSDEVYADLAIRHDLDHVSVYYFDGNINNTISINADKTWDPASTIKLYVAMYAFDQVSAGKLSLDQFVTVTDNNVAPSVSIEGGYQPLNAGDSVTVYELLDRMITQSGNTSYNTLVDLLDRREITKYIHDLGLVNSSLGAKLNLNDAEEAIDTSVPGYGPNVTNADDFARAFILINGRRLPGSPSLYDMLSRQKLNDMIPAYLPASVTVAHKTGELDPYYHDGGIITDAKKNYVLSIFTDGGDPSLVAHISQLIYTEDSNLIGSSTASVVSEGPLPAVDPLVAEANGQQVLAAVAQNVTLPAITASDIGMKSSDLSSVLDNKQLPAVAIPADSPLHFLVDIGGRINNYNPIVPLKLTFEASNLKLKLAEANDLNSRGKSAAANNLLSEVDTSLSEISKNKAVAGNTNLQTTINQVSETRFEMLKNQLASAPDKSLVIKEIARQAKNTADNVVPNIPQAVKKEALVQAPVIGKVVSATTNTITVQTPGGNNVTVQTDQNVKTRDAAATDSTVKPITQIQPGTEIAIAGSGAGNSKGSFIMTNLPVDSGTQTPVSVIKVDTKDNVLVVSKNGVPTQVDLTKQTVLKGSNDAVSLNNIVPGDILVVHGTNVNPPNASPSGGQATPASSTTSQGAPGNAPTTNQTTAPNATTINPSVVTSAPVAAPANQPANQPAKTTTKTTVTQPSKPSQPPSPPVIKGKVIEIVGSSAPSAPAPAKKAPAPAPATVPQPATKDNKKK